MSCVVWKSWELGMSYVRNTPADPGYTVPTWALFRRVGKADSGLLTESQTLLLALERLSA